MMSINEENLSEKRSRLIENYISAAAQHQDDFLDFFTSNNNNNNNNNATTNANSRQVENDFTAKLFALTRDQLDNSISSSSLMSSSTGSTTSSVDVVVVGESVTSSSSMSMAAAGAGAGDHDEQQTSRLIETALRYALAYLEESEYALKLTGVRLLDHLVDQIGASRLKVNMRAELVRDTLARYINDKDSLEFLDKSNELMIKLLGIFLNRFDLFLVDFKCYVNLELIFLMCNRRGGGLL